MFSLNLPLFEYNFEFKHAIFRENFYKKKYLRAPIYRNFTNCYLLGIFNPFGMQFHSVYFHSKWQNSCFQTHLKPFIPSIYCLTLSALFCSLHWFGPLLSTGVNVKRILNGFVEGSCTAIAIYWLASMVFVASSPSWWSLYRIWW